MQKIFLKTLGCKVNTFDSQSLENQLKSKGYDICSDAKKADVVVINSCSVTQAAEKEARYLLRRYKRENPDSKRVITGCYAQTESKALVEMPEVDLLVPNEIKEKAANVIDGFLRGESKFVGKLPEGVHTVHQNRQGHFKSSLVLFDKPSSDRVRAFLKIQDGCDGFCAYCLIPLARGVSRSVPWLQVIEQVKNLTQEGVLEIVFAGIHLGDYGHDFSEGEEIRSLADLLSKVLKEFEIPRFRLSSLEPAEVSKELIAVLKEHGSRFCDHFHLPLQSGSDKILKLMGRQYNCDEYLAKIGMIREVFPKAQISADVIPGFPGETEEDFVCTLAFIKHCKLSNLHVFPYSPRPNTRALRMPGHLSPEVIKDRAKILRDLGKELSVDFARRNIGSLSQVLWESKDVQTGRLIGKTKNYLDVVSAVEHGMLERSEVLVKLCGFSGEGKLLAVSSSTALV